MYCEHGEMEKGTNYCPSCGMTREKVEKGELGFIIIERAFPAAQLMITLLHILAWVGVGFGILIASIALVPLHDIPPAVASYVQYGRGLMLLFGLVLAFLTWLQMSLQAELIQIFLAIEENTRRPTRIS